jgi:hypothetical protein
MEYLSTVITQEISLETGDNPPIIIEFEDMFTEPSEAIYGQVWFDGNQDGLRQTFEAVGPIGHSVTISSTGVIPQELFSVGTEEDGYFHSQIVTDTFYELSTALAEGYTLTVVPESPVFVSEGQVLFGNDFGLYNDDLSILEGRIIDGNEDPISDIPVNLILDDLIIATAITAADGSYFFDGLERGYYSIEIAAPGFDYDSEIIPVNPVFDSTTDNPFAYENVVCDAFDGDDPSDWAYPDGSNPNYVRGLCLVEGVNVSGTTIVTCDNETGGEACADYFPWDAEAGEAEYPKVTEWIQTEENFDDPSWENPYDVSKGHRGFIDGDFVMLMYATAPNWKANTTGNEAYNLYIRRSFDGGQTWTTLPAPFTHINGVTYTGVGTESCEWYGWGGLQNEDPEVEVCTPYGPGEFEQARNVSQLIGSRTTVLDPRYTPTGGMLKTDYRSLFCYDATTFEWANCGNEADPFPISSDPPIGLETRDPSAYFVTYEVGDNTVVDVDTAAVPMDMYYSRATNFGDDYDVIDICADDEWPGSSTTRDLCDSGDEVLRWDWLENGPEIAAEASVTSSPAGDRFYQVWNEELEIAYEEYTDMDVIFRRIFYDIEELLYPDAPVATIVSVNNMTPLMTEDLELTGDAWDTDSFGGLPEESIVEVEWSLTFEGVTTVVDDGDGDPMSLHMPAGSMGPGLHTFSFRAKDNEGVWSAPVSVDIQVLPQYIIYIPVYFGP